MAIITLTPSKIGDVRSYYKRVRTVEQGGGVTSDNTTNSNRNNNYSGEAYAIAGTRSLNSRNSSSTVSGVTYITTTTTGWQQRMLVAFNLSGIEGTITAAKLRLYPATGDYSSNLKSFAIRRNTAAWNPATVTWNNQPANTSAGEKSAQFPSQRWTEVDVTAMVLADSGNYGFVVYNDDLDNHARFFAKSGSLVPQLVVTYTPYNSKIKTKPTTLPIDGETAGTVTIERYNSAYTHKLQVKLGSETQTFTDIDTTQTFTLPSSWLSQIPNATSGSATLTLWTYDAAGNQVGTTDVATFSATVPESIVPTVTASVEIVNSNPTVGGWGILLQSFSQIRVTAAGAAGTGATIASYAFSGAGMAQTGAANVCTGGVIQNSGTLTATIKLTDSRGRQDTANINVTVYPYATPTINGAEIYRCTSDGSRDDVGGTYISVKGQYGHASADGKNSRTVQILYRQNGASDWTTAVADALSETAYVIGNGEIDITKAYDVQIINTDALGNVTILSLVINQVVAALSLGLKNDRARFGGPVRKPGLEIDWDIDVHGMLQAPNLPRRNLLHNWDFTNPVNQRGVTSLQQDSTLAYFIDRWQVWDGNFSITDSGLQVAWNGTSGYNARIRQRIERKIFGTTVTVSAIIDDVLYQDSLTIPETANSASYGTTNNGIQFFVQNHDSTCASVGLVVNGTSTRTISRIKCEVGSASTLEQDSPSDYGEQLGLCQRYCVKLAGGTARYRPSHKTTSLFDFFIPLPVGMRTTPSYSGTFGTLYSYGGRSQTGFTFSVINSGSNGIVIRATKSSHGLTDAMLDVTSGLILSADL